MKVPVALLIFNRPQQTQRVFDRIRNYKPTQLLVIADGPRSLEEAAPCQAARSIVAQVDWDCDVLINYSEVNLGCKRRVSSGLNWVFDRCEEAIILEDDCVPHPSFFRYCTDLLDRYRHDERIMMINGGNFQFGRKHHSGSYYFSRYPHVWGWASWRRAWQHYDVEMRLWPTLRATSWLEDILGRKDVARYWRTTFDATFAGDINTWDYQWTFSCWAQSGLAIAPGVNLVSNIGFGEGATHTTVATDRGASIPTTEIIFPLRHPTYVARNVQADRFESAQDVPTGISSYLPPVLRLTAATLSTALRTLTR